MKKVWGDGIFVEKQTKKGIRYEYKKYVQHKDGRRRRKTFVKATREECLHCMQAFEESLKDEKLSDLIYTWIKTDRKNISVSTNSTQKALVKSYIEGTWLENTELNDEMIEKYFNELYERVSSGTLKNVSTLLSQFTKNRDDLHVVDVMNKVLKGEPEKSRKIVYLTDEELEKFTEVSKARFSTGTVKNRLGGIIVVNCCIGLSTSELCSLRWSDVDLDNRIVTVSRRMKQVIDRDAGQLTTVEEPLDKERVVPIPNEAMDLLLWYKDNMQDLTGHTDLVLHTSKYNSVTPTKILAAINLTAKHAKINKPFSTSLMRDTSVYRYLKAGKTPDEICSVLGISFKKIEKEYQSLIQS